MKSYKELILCIAISAVLTVLFIGAVDTDKAKLVQCNNNLRGFLKSLQRYAETHGVMPPVWTPQKPLWTFWGNNLDPMHGMKTEHACPADTRNAHMQLPPNPLAPTVRRMYHSSYGMNERCHTYNSKTRRATMHNFANPEKLILFGDAKGPMLQPVQNPGDPRHSKKYHYITASGAIRLYTAEELGKQPNGRFKPSVELWSPWR